MKPVSDEYGFVGAALSGLRIFESAMRGTGRTTRLIERVTDDDRIIVGTVEVHRYVSQLIKAAGKKTQVVVVKQGGDPMGRLGTTPNGRTYFEHSFVLLHAEHCAKRAADDLDFWSRQMSRSEAREQPQFDSEAARRVSFGDA